MAHPITSRDFWPLETRKNRVQQLQKSEEALRIAEEQIEKMIDERHQNRNDILQLAQKVEDLESLAAEKQMEIERLQKLIMSFNPTDTVSNTKAPTIITDSIETESEVIEAVAEEEE